MFVCICRGRLIPGQIDLDPLSELVMGAAQITQPTNSRSNLLTLQTCKFSDLLDMLHRVRCQLPAIATGPHDWPYTPAVLS